VFVFCAAFSYFLFDHVPHVHDEIDYLFQAKIFLTGRLFAVSPCAKEFFDFSYMINDGRWYSIYSPGFPLLLTLGLVVRAPWLLNPLLAALTIFLFYFLGTEIYDRRIGILSSVLGAASIWFLLMSSTMMSHTGSLFFSSIFLLFLFRSLKKPTFLNGIGAAAGLGMAFLIRPYNAVFFAFPYFLYYSLRFLKNFRARLKNAAAFIITLAAFLSVYLIYNYLTTGHPLRNGYVAYFGQAVLPGFGRAPFHEAVLTPIKAAENIFNYIKAIHRDLFGWPLSSFLALIPLLLSAKLNPAAAKKDLLVSAGFFSLLIGLYFYWATFVDIGARLLFETIVVLVLLSARGIAELYGLFKRKFSARDTFRWKNVLTGILIIFTAYAFVVRFPRWLWPRDTDWYYARYDHNFAGATSRINAALKSLDLKNAVVIMKILHQPLAQMPDGWWSSGFLFDDPDLKGEILYANDRGESNILLLDCFPGRNFYLYFGTLEKGMVLPLRKEAGNMNYGAPLVPAKPARRAVELIRRPQDFYSDRSPEFEKFLDGLYREHEPFEIDVVRLTEWAVVYKRSGDFERAAFCLEAALQLEKDPDTKILLINQLKSCYIKLGKYQDIKKIIKKSAAGGHKSPVASLLRR